MKPQEGIFKVVSAYDLEKHTKEGWQLFQVLAETVPDVTTRQEIAQSPYGNPISVATPTGMSVGLGQATSYSTVQTLSDVVLARKHVYLLRLDPNSVHEEMRKHFETERESYKVQIANLEEKAKSALNSAAVSDTAKQTAVTALNDAEKKLKKAQDDLMNTKASLSETFLGASQAHSKLAEAEESSRRWQNQVAKIWAHLGTLEMEKLLGSDAQHPDPKMIERTAHQHLMALDDD
jgi:hypothetical protein